MGEQLALFSTRAPRRAPPRELRDAHREGPYRYTLSRVWDEAGDRACFVMLNPSTADASVDDPTIRSCRRLARVFGCGGFVAVNLFAWRATDVADLVAAHRRGDDVVGPLNDEAIVRAAPSARMIVAAWGANAVRDFVRARAEQVLATVLPAGRTIYCLSRLRDGHPQHPLFANSRSTLQILREARDE